MPTTHVVRVDKGILWVDIYDHSGNYVSKDLGRTVQVKNIYKILESNDILLELFYNYLGEKRNLIIPRSDLRKNELLKYADQGLNINESNARYVIEHIASAEQGNIPKLLHKHLGWNQSTASTDGDIFKGYKAWGVESDYNGKLPVKPQGKIKDFRKFVRNHVNDSPLALAVAIGLSSVIVGYLGGDESLITHFYGDSSIGKTTAAKLAVAMGSLPSFHAEHSLLNDYDGTENALLATLIGNRGYPACFDEANLSGSRDFSTFIYRLASGRGKRRLTKDGQQKDIESYLTTIVSTGEKGLTGNANQNTGKEIRVLQFGNISWTNSADHADLVNSFIVNNYGWPVIFLAKHLMKIGKVEATRVYEKNRMLFIEKSLVKNSFTNRLSGKYAYILTAVELINDCMRLKLPYEDILNWLLQNETENLDNRDIAQKAYDYLMEQINTNIDKFSLANTGIDGVDASREVWGIRVPQRQPLTVDNRRCTMIIYVAKEKFRELLSKGKFEESSVIIKKFKQKQWLDHDSDRDTRQRKITNGGTPIHVYGLRVFEDSSNDTGVLETPKAVRKPLSKKG